jgi:hypothetical protein
MQVPPFSPRERLILSVVMCQNIDNCVIFLNIFRSAAAVEWCGSRAQIESVVDYAKAQVERDRERSILK